MPKTIRRVARVVVSDKKRFPVVVLQFCRESDYFLRKCCNRDQADPKEKSMSDSRPQVLAQKNFLQHRDRLETMELKHRFAYIFENNLWGSDESHSGLGSTLRETAALRREIPALLREIGVHSVLDIPCGDFRWMNEMDMEGIRYVGADIVEAIVAKNRQKFDCQTRRFVGLDLTCDQLPSCDVVLSRDCLVHLSYQNIGRALKNVKRSGTNWLLMTNFLRIETNREIADGDWRPLNFELAPFGFPKPERTIVEGCVECDGAFDDKALCLWPIADIP